MITHVLNKLLISTFLITSLLIISNNLVLILQHQDSVVEIDLLEIMGSKYKLFQKD